MQNQPYKVSRRRKHSAVWPVLLMLAAAAVIALAIAGAWQVAEGKPFFPPSGEFFPKPESSSSEDADQNTKSADSKAENESSSSQEQNENSSVSSSSQPPEASEPEAASKALPVFEGAVPESAAVSQNYFDDAVFVGDSITEGMTIYSGMSNAKILAYTGINFSTISTTPVLKQEDGTRVTIMDELGKARYNKVYVMLGGNEVGYMDENSFIQRYEKVLEQVEALQSGAIIYVQSMTPVTETNGYNLDNDRIDEYNQAILEMCKRRGLYFLNVAECMKDSRGMLPTEASPKDGMHFGQEYFDKWFAYLKTHTVDGPSQPAAAVSSGEGQTASTPAEDQASVSFSTIEENGEAQEEVSNPSLEIHQEGAQ